ncbi:MAG: alanine dehydrogenase [Planctomycetes bacterium]|nr:alanine dehydrogenase [Planctomycetota bacterium]
MIIGIPKEIKPYEFRVAIVSDGVEQLVRRGHQVLLGTQAGEGSGITDEEYKAAGAEIVPEAAQLYERAEMIMKVKEPQPEEQALLREGQIIYAYFHFAASEELTRAVQRSGAVAIAYETMHTADGRIPALTPMSEVAGKMAVQEGAKYLERPMMGRGILLGGVPGVDPAEVMIIGGGTVGANAAKMAAGLGARVTIFDINLERLRYLDDVMPKNVTTLFCNTHNLRDKITTADLVIGAVLIEGARAPVLITEDMVKTMQRGAVIVDVAVDQGGCIETSRPTTHGDPTFIVHGVVHYGVTNMPGAVARTSTIALTNATIGYAVEIADKGWARAAADNPVIASGLNICRKQITNRAVAQTFGLALSDPAAMLA